MFKFECATCGKAERRAIDHVSLVKLRNLKDLCDLNHLKEPKNWRTEICESEGCLPLRPKPCECTGPLDWMYTWEKGAMVLKEQYTFRVRLTCKQFRATEDEINFGRFVQPERRPRQGDFRCWLHELMELPETTLKDMACSVTVDDSIIDEVKRWRDAVAKSAAAQNKAKDKAKKGAAHDKEKRRVEAVAKDKAKKAGGTKVVTKTKAKAATRKAAAKKSIEKPDPIAQADNWDWFLERMQQTDPGNAV